MATKTKWNYKLVSHSMEVLCEGLLEECLLYYKTEIDADIINQAFEKAYGKSVVLDYGCTIKGVGKHKVITTYGIVLYEGLIEECFAYWMQNYRELKKDGTCITIKI